SGNLSATGPINQTNCPNTPAMFSTTASSPEPISYQWRFNGQTLAGRTTNSLVLASVTAADAGVYSVEVRTDCAARTNSATLTVLQAPSGNPITYTNTEPIIIQESGQAIPYGSRIT